MRRALKLVGAGLALTTGATAGGVAYAYNTDPGARRTLQFGARVTPLCTAYTMALYRDYANKADREAALESLHREYAPQVLQIVLQMKGYYIKAAQMMCGVGMLPAAYEEELKCLLDSVPPRDSDLIKRIIEDELQCPLSELFETFDDQPIGAASIGQVHTATLRGSKHKVVVKVQYPEVEEYFRLDLFTIKTLCSYFLENSDQLFEEVGKSFESEFDYQLEAQNLRLCGRNMVAAGFERQVFIPQPVDGTHPVCPPTRAGGLCTKRVMVMDAVQGVPVKKRMNQVLSEMAAEQNKSQLMDEMNEQFRDPVMLDKFLNTPPPSELEVRAGLAYMKLRDIVRNGLAMTYNYTLGLGGVLGTPIEYKWSTIPPNGPKLTRLLYQVHGHQVLVDGRFNADPHAGNVLICDDGRLGLIDYGNAPTLSPEERLTFAQLIVALDERNDPEILRLFKQLGYKCSGGMGDKLLLMSAYGDFDQQYGTAFFNEHFGYPKDADLMQVMELMQQEISQSKTEMEAPALIINLQRCVMTLNGVASVTGAGNVRPSAMWRAQADAVIAKAR